MGHPLFSRRPKKPPPLSSFVALSRAAHARHGADGLCFHTLKIVWSCAANCPLKPVLPPLFFFCAPPEAVKPLSTIPPCPPFSLRLAIRWRQQMRVELPFFGEAWVGAPSGFDPFVTPFGSDPGCSFPRKRGILSAPRSLASFLALRRQIAG